MFLPIGMGIIRWSHSYSENIDSTVSHGKTLFVVQTTHSAHLVLIFITMCHFCTKHCWVKSTVEVQNEKCHNKMALCSGEQLSAGHLNTYKWSQYLKTGMTLKAVATLGHSNTSHVNTSQNWGLQGSGKLRLWQTPVLNQPRTSLAVVTQIP